MSNKQALEIVFNFDTTGSMYPCLDQVRRHIENAATELFKEFPNLKIGLGANGDYCDRGRTYVTKQLNLTSNLHNLVNFARTTERTGGGDFPEAYELVLHEARDGYSWSPAARKIFVLIGDATPHEASYPLNTLRLDWRAEARKLADRGIDIYTIQCLSRRESNHFYETVADIGKGYHLRLDQFTDIAQLVSAIVYRQDSQERVQEYEQVVAKSGRMNRTLDASFGILTGQPRDARGRFAKIDTSLPEDLRPVEPGRFQMMVVDHEATIQQFVKDRDLLFKTGKGFYEFTKSEEIRPKREVVLRDPKTGDMFSGKAARDMIGVPFGVHQTLSPRTMKTSIPYDVFIQSTSYTRKLKKGTRFLYEVDMDS